MVNSNISHTSPLPLASQLDSFNLDFHSPYPEISDLDTTVMSLTWIKSLFTRATELSEKAMPVSHKYSRTSSDLESLASGSDEGTLLEDDRIEEQREKRRPAVDARIVSDAIIGLSDGLTVPFALTAGLSALGDTRVVIFGGTAELIAGAISMGLGGYLGAKSEECVSDDAACRNCMLTLLRQSYRATLSTTEDEVARTPSAAATSISEVFAPFELPQNLTDDLAFHLAKSPHLTQFLMNFQHNLPEPAGSRAITCALTIAAGYFLGGFIPLIPYFLVPRTEVLLALYISLGVMALCLFIFGYVKTCFVSGWKGSRNIMDGTKGGLQMVVVGGLAAGCAMGLVRLFHSWAPT